MCKTLIYIGKDYYWNSGTVMSSLVGEQGQREDWSTVEQALRDGNAVTIRPATPVEIKWADSVLAALKGKKP